MGRKFTIKPNTKIHPCPKCGNNTRFVAHSQQVAEDCCDVWVTCGKCNFEPLWKGRTNRLEDVWGGVDDDNCFNALQVWNENIEETV